MLVVNCSLFNPTPSLSAMIINKFKMRTNIESYNLGGMGCSAGRHLDRSGQAPAGVAQQGRVRAGRVDGEHHAELVPGQRAVDADPEHHLPDGRGGDAADQQDDSEARRSLYELEHIVRVHLGAQDDAFRCVYQHEDSQQKIGVELNKDLVKVAARALEVNLTKMGPLVLPWGEKLAFAANWIARKLLHVKIQPYIPRFNKAFDHFCLHAGGRAVVTGLSRQLDLSEDKMAPSANSLHWYGNTYV